MANHAESVKDIDVLIASHMGGDPVEITAFSTY